MTIERKSTINNPTLSDAGLAALREKHPALAEVVDSDRALTEMRRTNVIDLSSIRLRRDRVALAAATWGHQLRGQGPRRA